MSDVSLFGSTLACWWWRAGRSRWVSGLPGVGLAMDVADQLDLPVIMATVINGDFFNRDRTLSSTSATPLDPRCVWHERSAAVEARDPSGSFRTQDGTVHAVDGVC